MPLANRLLPTLLLAAAAACGALAPASAQPATPLLPTKGTADEMFDAVRAAEELDAALAAADAFVAAYPQDERSAQLLYLLGQNAIVPTEALTYYRKLAELHPDTSYARLVERPLRLGEKLGQPFELTFTPLGASEPLSVQEDLKGKVVVIDFWATWCVPCIAEFPEMKKLYAQYKDQGVEFIGVSCDAPEAQGGKRALENMVAAKELPWPQYYQGDGMQSEFSKSWGVQQLPQVFIVDAEGKLYSVDAHGKLDELIPQLLAARDAQVAAE